MSINPTLQNSAFLGNNDFTWWLGTVENPDDRDAKLGRVRVKFLVSMIRLRSQKIYLGHSFSSQLQMLR